MSKPNLDDPLVDYTVGLELDEMDGDIAKHMAVTYQPGSVVIRNESDYNKAHAFRELLRTFVDGCKAVHDEYQADLKAAIARGNTRHTKRVASKVLIDAELKNEMARFQTEKHATRQARIDRVNEIFEKEQVEQRIVDVERLQAAIGKAANRVEISVDDVDREQWEAEVKELQTALSEAETMPIDVLDIPREATPGTISNWNYRLDDLTKVKEEYIERSIRHSIVLALAKAHGKKAEKMVGGITCIESIVPKRDARRKR